MSAPDQPTTAKTAHSPKLPSNGIVISAPEQVTRSGALVLSGAFRFDRAVADRIDSQLHRAVVVAATHVGGMRACTPFREQALFPDDEERSDAVRSGYFELDLRRWFDLAENDVWFLHASIAGQLSNIIKVRIG
jgi:hypothetical protein